ncbi:short transient receptor potential channel 7-like [Liolophura sinensis]|uniref:short transient receptor potential channel 7-like n=1 Tax=Liolophura sinensis TaxID=3198878 RepID=UPI0031582D5A
MDVFINFQGPKNEVEEKLLLACSTSDIPAIAKMLAKKEEINFDCVDLLGRTPLQLAVENEDIEATKLLLPYCEKRNIEDCLLFAISLSSENLAMAMLKHPRYIDIDAQNRKLADSSSFDVLPSNSKFPTNTTPLVLAAEQNLYEVVRHLLVEGHTICKPHPLSCPCVTCAKKSKADYFRFAHERLNAYRGLASECYLSLSSDDPILDAFMLRKTFLKLAETEEHFKSEYCDLAKALSVFSVKLLNKVIGDNELDTILDKVGSKDQDKYAPLGRVKLAVKLQEKRFVAHPSCQMRLKKLWYEDFPILGRGPFLKRAAIVILFVLCYPFLAAAYICAPKFKHIKFMRSPCAKFIAHVYFYLMLLGQLLWTTIVALPYRSENNASWDMNVTQSYFRTNANGSYLLRSGQATTVHYLIFVWVLGLLWQEVKELYRDGWREHFSAILNWVDAIMLTTYLVSFGFRFYAVSMVQISTEYFREYQHSDVYNMTLTPIELLDLGDSMAEYYYKWLNPDRYYWSNYDPVICAEGLFAIANVLDFTRFASLLPAFEALGTLQISFGYMMKDILRFMGLFGLVLVAFMVGLANLYWFYGIASRQSVELSAHDASTAEAYFGNIGSTFNYCFWSLFGMGESDAPDLTSYREIPFTETIGYILYGVFMVCCVIVLLNLLIAMMSLSFSQIQDDADVEWKFSRTQLFFDYMFPGATLPVPLNLIPTPKTVFYAFKFICGCCKRKKNKTQDLDKDEIETSSDGSTEATGVSPQNGTLVAVNGTNQKFEIKTQTKYKIVISRIVRRFINDASTSKDDNNEDDNLKHDLLRIRRELTNALEMRAREIEQCRKDIAATKNTFVADLSACRTAISRVEASITNIAVMLSKQAEEKEVPRQIDRRGSIPAAMTTQVTSPLASAQVDARQALEARVGTPAPVLAAQTNSSSTKLGAIVPAVVNNPAKYSPP